MYNMNRQFIVTLSILCFSISIHVYYHHFCIKRDKKHFVFVESNTLGNHFHDGIFAFKMNQKQKRTNNLTPNLKNCLILSNLIYLYYLVYSFRDSRSSFWPFKLVERILNEKFCSC